MKYLRLFEKEVDYVSVEDEQVSFIEEIDSSVYYTKNTIKLTDLKVGDNIGGMKLFVANKSFPKTLATVAAMNPKFTAASSDGKIVVQIANANYLVFAVVTNGSGVTTSFYSPRPDEYGGPYFTDSVLQLPSVDLFVKDISLPVHPDDESWGFDYMVVE